MQTSTAQPEANITRTTTTTTTKSREQILTQSSGAMIAVIVIGVIIILTILLIVLKTYNRRTHASRMLGSGASARPRKKASSTTQTNLAMRTTGPDSTSGSFTQSQGPSERGFQLPRADLGAAAIAERHSVRSGSAAATIHDTPSIGDT
ncbi:noncompact myelin-associated protein [Denticeps clupeoides]|uniref:noncompact myelin-associated protein n=1 Tax=Denticeps clupeoides TaxID=299321 RepID=UPI0010A40ADF|nr:noncompact myelin-associated protein [Denticeps clupeoides]